MTVDEKRYLLKKLCNEMRCSECPYDSDDSWCYDYTEESLPENMLDEVIAGFPNATTTVDNVNRPPHYTQGGIECIDAMTAAFGKEAVMHFCICNAFKYIWRSEHKNGQEDLDKANWYIKKYKQLKESV